MKNKNTKRLSALLAAMLVLTTLAACGETLVEPEQTTTAPVQTTAPAQTTAPQETTLPAQTDPPAVYETLPDIQASYEQWLAGAMVVAATMEYPEYLPVSAYTLTETQLENKLDSSGVFLVISDGVQELILHSTPLAAERDTAGTRDLSTAQLGYATFDMVVMSPSDLGGLKEMSMDELMEMSIYAMLVSVSYH